MNPAIEKMAREAGYPVSLMTLQQTQPLEAFAQAVAKRCAELCDERRACSSDLLDDGDVALFNAANAIRSEFGLPATGQGGG